MNDWFSRALALSSTACLALAVLVAFAAVIHLLEQILTRRLVRRFGWSSLLWTGWLGTPIHELSHVIACIAFGHRIDQVALFRPDPAQGQLGFVRHSYRPGNGFQEIGNLFIAISPLVGGALAMMLAIKLCFPEIRLLPEVDPAISAASVESSDRSLGGPWTYVGALLRQIVAVENVSRPSFWIFLYVATCIAGHMAPSRSDYRSAIRATFWLLLVIVAGVVTAAVTPASALAAQYIMAVAGGLTLTIALLSIALSLVAVAIVFVITAAWDAWAV
jgi:hypothetical protein